MKSIRTIVSTALVAGLAFFITSVASFAASEFEGVWTVKNNKGDSFEITLAGDGKATSTMPEAPKGTWKEEGNAAFISWDSGWTIKPKRATSS